MVDPISSSGGYVAPLASGGGVNAQKAQTFKPAVAAQTTSQTGDIAVVNVRYTSPVLVVDPGTKIVVYEQRDPETGQVLNQYPSQKAVQQYAQADQQSSRPLNDQKVSSNQAPATATSVAPSPIPVAKVGLSSVITAGVTTGPQVEPAGNLTE
jgi:hypothetical protein